MNFGILFCGALVAAMPLAGCSNPGPVDNRGGQHTAQTNPKKDLDAPENRRMITGSNVPQQVNRPTYAPTSATTPLESAARNRPSLIPTEPTVGAGGQSDYRADEPSTGAGPAGSNPNTGSH